LFYYCFRIPPYQSKKIASVRKEKKLYLWDWSVIEEDGQRLENLVASHLLKYCETFAKCLISFKFKEDEKFNHRNTLSISRIKF